MVDGQPPESPRPSLDRELQLQARERVAPARRAEMYKRLGYQIVEDPAGERQFAALFQSEFPKVLGDRTENLDETNPDVRKRMVPPECSTLQTESGERLWALTFNERMTIVVGSDPATKTDVDEQYEGTVLPVRNFLLGERKPSGGAPVMTDMVPYLHSFQRRWGQSQTEVYMSLPYMDPYYFPGDESEANYIVFPIALGRQGPAVVPDTDETVSQLIHEGGHAARAEIDEASQGHRLVKQAASERGAHAVGLLLAHRLRRFVDVKQYRRFMRSALGSYDQTDTRERASLGAAAYASNVNRRQAARQGST